jgi:hypothetical protein
MHQSIATAAWHGYAKDGTARRPLDEFRRSARAVVHADLGSTPALPRRTRRRGAAGERENAPVSGR